MCVWVFLMTVLLFVRTTEDCPYSPRQQPSPLPYIVRFCSWNAYYLINSTVGTPWKNQGEVNDHYDDILTQVAEYASESVDSINLLGMQSIQDCGVLKEMKGKLSSYNFSPYQNKINGYLQQVGMLSQYRPSAPGFQLDPDTSPYPIIGSKCSENAPKMNFTTLGRHVFGSFVVSGLDFLVFNIHLTSTSDADGSESLGCYIREAETRLLINYIHRLLALSSTKTTVIILGTFNDYDSECEDPEGHVSKSRVFEWLRDDLGLYNVLKRTDPLKRVTYWEEGKGYLLDYILVSQHAINCIEDVNIHRNLFPNHTEEKDNFTDVFPYHVPVSFDVNLRKLHDVLYPDNHNKEDSKKTYYWVIPVVVCGCLLIYVFCGLLCCCCVVCVVCLNGFGVTGFTSLQNLINKKGRRGEYLFMGKEDEQERERLARSMKKRKKGNLDNEFKKNQQNKHFKIESFKVI